MSRVLEAETYPSRPQLKFGIDPSRILFSHVADMVKLSAAEREYQNLTWKVPFTVGILKKVGADIAVSYNKSGASVVSADIAFWLKNLPGIPAIAQQGQYIREILQSEGLTTDYREEPDLGTTIGITTGVGNRYRRVELYLPSTEFIDSGYFDPRAPGGYTQVPIIAYSTSVQADSYEDFKTSFDFLNKSASASINAIHTVFNSAPAEVRYIFNLTPRMIQ